jgi:hypothetical protein
MNVDQLNSWENELATEVDRLREELERKEEELRHVSRLRELREGKKQEVSHEQGQGTIPILHPQSGGRRSIAELRPAYFEWNGHRFRTPGEFLDYMGEPHYFSRVRGGRSDAAQRKIVVWAKRNEGPARRLMVVLQDGRSFSLWEIVQASP